MKHKRAIVARSRRPSPLLLAAATVLAACYAAGIRAVRASSQPSSSSRGGGGGGGSPHRRDRRRHRPPSAAPSSPPSRGARDDDDAPLTTGRSSPAPSGASAAGADHGESSSSGGVGGGGAPSSSSSSSSVTFLHELYEHEVYNPSSDTWGGRRFTQSPVAGGGGRDSTTLDPSSCTPPRNYLFDGEWRIDLGAGGGGAGHSYSSISQSSSSANTRDGFGWEYYVGRYDGLGRRRRRWVRNLRRVSSPGGIAAARAKADAASASSRKKKKKEEEEASKSRSGGGGGRRRQGATTTTASKSSVNSGMIARSLREQYDFKGFGWSFYKSLLFRRSAGATLRVPLSSAFDAYDRRRALPFVSQATYLGYPWVAAASVSASLPMEAIEWLVAGTAHKVRWCLAVASAFVRCVVELAIGALLLPLRLCGALVATVAELAGRATGVGGRLGRGGIQRVRIETHIELSNSSERGVDGSDDGVASAAAVADAPRGGGGGGGATNTTTAAFVEPSFREKHRTISGGIVPPFCRPNPIEYSDVVQRRMGLSLSWRVSQEYGYEYRWNFFFTCVPTMLFWRKVGDERARVAEEARRWIAGGVWGKLAPSTAKQVGTDGDNKRGDGKDSSAGSGSTLKSSSSKGQSSKSRRTNKLVLALANFLNDHYSAYGISVGYPLPRDPFFSLSLFTTLNGFFYGWLLRYIRSLFVLPTSKLLVSEEDVLGLNSTISLAGAKVDKEISEKTEKLVSSALKKKLPLNDKDGGEVVDDVESDVELDSNSTSVANLANA